jgi:hypothetical protein
LKKVKLDPGEPEWAVRQAEIGSLVGWRISDVYGGVDEICKVAVSLILGIVGNVDELLNVMDNARHHSLDSAQSP